MTEEQVISAIKDQHFGGDELDIACVSRLYELSYDFGEGGRIARQLLDIVSELIGV